LYLLNEINEKHFFLEWFLFSTVYEFKFGKTLKQQRKTTKNNKKKHPKKIKLGSKSNRTS